MIFFRVDGIVDRWIVSYRNLAILPNRLYLLSTLNREKWVARPNKNVVIILFCWKINSCSEKNLASTNFVHCVHFHFSIAVPYLQNFFSNHPTLLPTPSNVKVGSQNDKRYWESFAWFQEGPQLQPVPLLVHSSWRSQEAHEDSLWRKTFQLHTM